MKANFGYITKVPLATELIDIALNKTQRKTPTVVHPQFVISRIRDFYMKKVRFCSLEFTTRLNNILSEFPRLEDIHPFYADLINVLYDRDHYKVALGHINATKKVCENVAKEFVKLLKFGDSPYRCKQLKRAALGRMAHAVKKLNKTLEYLEEVRMHMTRLPSIDPTSRTLIICGFPNVGKSSFMNKVSRAEVEVQPYAFTTKNLYVGHFDYNYLKWQIIDTPGILDHPLEDRNTIEMLSITALAHLTSSVLYFIDLSETCGYSVEQQISLYESLKPLLNSKMVIVLSKSDIKKLEAGEELITSFLSGKCYMECSVELESNIEAVKKLACDMLLDERVEKKVDGNKIQDYINRIKLVKPRVLHEKEESHACLMKISELGKEQDRYFVPDEYKYDVIPEIYNGKNVADFVNGDIDVKLSELEEEEDRLFNFYNKTYDLLSPEEQELKNRILKVEQENMCKAAFSKAVPVNVKWDKRMGVDTNDASIRKPAKQLQLLDKVECAPTPLKKARFDDNFYYEKRPKYSFRPASKKKYRKR